MAKEKITEMDIPSVVPEMATEESKRTQKAEHVIDTAKIIAVKYIGEHRDTPIPLRQGDIFYGLPQLLEQALQQDAQLNALFIPVE